MDIKKYYNLVMFVDCNFDIYHRYYTIDEVLPYPQYKSGTKDTEKPVYQDKMQSTSNPILTLEFDIVNEYGFGLKKGFYEIATNDEMSVLMFVESGIIKAKIPVIKQEIINKFGSNYEWDDTKNYRKPNYYDKDLTLGTMVSSRKIYNPVFSEKEKKARKKKYKKGQDPSTYFHSKVYMEYDRELDLYRVIWEKYNTRLIGIIKI